jgi:glycosyltransferase involved in cell wall biosynthesis
MRILWICGLPRQVQREVLHDEDYGAHVEWSWILGHLPPPDGIELHIACRTARHTVARDFTYSGAHFHLVPVKTRGRVLCLFRFDWIFFRRLKTELNPDVIHGWGTEDAFANIAIKLAPERHVIEIQGNLNTYLKRVKMSWMVKLAAFNERLILARARNVAAENEYSLGSALPMVRTKSVFAIEHPIRPDFLTARPSDGGASQVLFLGNIEERKGIWDALEAFRKGAPRDWRMAIIGNGAAERVARLKQLISEQDLAGRVFHHPKLDAPEIISMMQASSIFHLPTRIDTGPTALKEALSMGLWPVCYDNSGPGHYIRKFQYGSLADDLSLPALTEALRLAIADQPWKIGGNREKVISQIRPHFERLRVWRELIGVYERICRS